MSSKPSETSQTHNPKFGGFDPSVWEVTVQHTQSALKIGLKCNQMTVRRIQVLIFTCIGICNACLIFNFLACLRVQS